MTDNNHPITPPQELVQLWAEDMRNAQYFATKAARWGADQELEACCEWLDAGNWKHISRMLRAARRPKPPSLQDQALDDLERIAALLMEKKLPCDTGNIRRKHVATELWSAGPPANAQQASSPAILNPCLISLLQLSLQ